MFLGRMRRLASRPAEATELAAGPEAASQEFVAADDANLARLRTEVLCQTQELQW